MIQYFVHKQEETVNLARKIAEVLPLGSVVLLEGPLGSGKTTFTQAFGRAKGIRRAIKSPTYTIVKEYDLDDRSQLIHIDAYRLEKGGAETIDFDQYLRGQDLIFIEWSIYMRDFLPEDYLQIRFIPQEDIQARQIEISAKGPKSQAVLASLEAVND